MTSKEIIEKKIKLALHDFMAEDNSYYYELQIKEYNQVLKDLDELEEYREIMGTPIQDIMKKLKVLEILKKCEDEKHSLYCVYVLNALSSGKITQDDVINVKEWLDA